MSKDRQSYELLARGVDADDDNIHNAQLQPTDEERPPPPTTPQDDVKPLLLRNPTSTYLDRGATIEEPNIALQKSIKPLLLSLLIHLVPSIATISIVQLSFRSVFWFDIDPDDDRIWRNSTITLNELLNLLQFVAKIHEILLVASLSAMAMHRVRNRLIGKRGLPFGMMTAGYSVGSAEYLISPAFWSGFNKSFWSLSLLILAFTLLANTFGPASAIALVPNLDWWPMSRPFNDEGYSGYMIPSKEQLWPQEITKDHTLLSDGLGGKLPETYCFSADAFITSSCPAGGYNDMIPWVGSNNNNAAFANITMGDNASPAQRILTSQLTPSQDIIPGVAITTSASQSIMAIAGGFWEQVRRRKLSVNDAVRPKFQLPDQGVLQPLVQVQCDPWMLSTIQEKSDKFKERGVGGNEGINTFTPRNASRLRVPDWVYTLKYNYSNGHATDDSGKLIIQREQTVNLTWLDSAQNGDFDLSLAALVTTPMYYPDTNNKRVQVTMAHFCSVDARWIGSDTAYDPKVNAIIQHNITSPLIFQKQPHATEETLNSDLTTWGVSPALKLSTEWAAALNIPTVIDNSTAPAMHWLLGQYVIVAENSSNKTDDNESSEPELNYQFSPGAFILSEDGSVNSSKYITSASETVATVLGLQITDGLARIHRRETEGASILTKHVNETHVIMESMIKIAGGFSIEESRQTFSMKEVEETAKSKYTFTVERYGYGYGFKAATVYFGIIILLSHTVLVYLYIGYALFDFFYVTHWTSSAWGGMAELAALLINSKPTVELKNTCAGVDSKHTWRKTVWIRETERGHLGLVVGHHDAALYRHAMRDVPYGAIREGSGLRRRRGSV